MTPAQFQARVKKGTVPAATLLLGPEAYERRRIKDALVATVPADAKAAISESGTWSPNSTWRSPQG